MISTAKILKDSISPDGARLTSFECQFPRIVLAEVNTHCQLARNSASSRAIPIEKMIQRVQEQPYVPTHWGKNQKGMKAEEDVGLREADLATQEWELARNSAVEHTKALQAVGIHKQITNRLIEPFMWHTAIVTATEWSNFFNLRDNSDAHPDFRDLAHAMRELHRNSTPVLVPYGCWHMPYVTPVEEFDLGVNGNFGVRVSVGRCARVSYLTQDGKRDPQQDFELAVNKLLAAGHMSPWEHVARPMTTVERELFKQKKLRWNEEHQCWYWVGAKYRQDVGDRGAVYQSCEPWDPGAELDDTGEYIYFLAKFQGWVQARKLIPHEEDILGARS